MTVLAVQLFLNKNMMKKKQSWCFDDSEVVDLKPASSRICIRRSSLNINTDEIYNFCVHALLMSDTEATETCEALASEGEWLIGVYSSDMAETILEELSSLVRDHKIDLVVSSSKE